MNESQKISWTATEYDHTHKEPDWFWALFIVAGAGSVAALIYGNVLFAIVVLLSAFTIATHANKKPELVNFEITKRGVRIGEKLYLYDSLEAFCIKDESHKKKLLLQSTRLFMPLLVIPLGETNPRSVEEFLKEFLQEETIHEPLAQKLFEYFGF
jgi:hypothetical protein